MQVLLKVIPDIFTNPKLGVEEEFPWFRHLIDDFPSVSPVNLILLTFSVRQKRSYCTIHSSSALCQIKNQVTWY